MKLLVTGHTGFLGSAFVEACDGEHTIVGYDISGGDDLLDYENLLAKMQGCDQVVHLAAIPKPVEDKIFEDYFSNNDQATLHVAKAAVENNVKRIVYASSTTIYGIERGIPFKTPITEDQPFISQYLKHDQLSCRECDLSYHMSKVIAEQIMAWYGLNKKVQTTALRYGPIDKVFLGTSVSLANAVHATKLAVEYDGEFWYEAFSIVDDIDHIDITKAKNILGYQPETPVYTEEQKL